MLQSNAYGQENLYHLWSGVNYLSIVTEEESREFSYILSKRNNSECSNLSSSPTSSTDSAGTERSSYAPFSRHASSNLDYLAAVSQNAKLNVCCCFCKNNGEPQSTYASHTMKNSNGKVTCPRLKAYTCPYCGQSGETAHTITYCKVYKQLKRENMLNSLKK